MCCSANSAAHMEMTSSLPLAFSTFHSRAEIQKLKYSVNVYITSLFLKYVDQRAMSFSQDA